MPRLQIAVDTFTTQQALLLSDEIYDVVDLFEVGTPMILRDGVHPVRQLKERHPELKVLADTKIVDGGSLECADACAAGADVVTVLAMACDSTIRGVVETAHRFGREVMADLLQVTDIARRAQELVAMGVDYVCVHTAVDAQGEGKTPLGDLRELVRAIPPRRAAAAGGINLQTLDVYLAEKPAVIIMGGALCGAPDVRAAALEAKRRVGEA